MKDKIEQMVSRINSSDEAKRILEENLFDQKVVIGTNEGERFTLEIIHQKPTVNVKKGSVPFKMFKTGRTCEPFRVTTVPLPLRQIRKIEDLIDRYLFRDRFGLEAVADGVGCYHGVDLAVRRFGSLVIVVDFPC